MNPDGGREASRGKGRRTLLLLFLVCAAPVLASYFAFYVVKPDGRVNYGEVLAQPVKLWEPAAIEPALRGKWVLLMAASADCDALCRQQLWVTRQVRTAQAQEMDRLARAWAQPVAGMADPALLAEHPGIVLMREPWLAEAVSGRAIGLVDPHGMLMMRYPAEPDAKRMIKDLQRLLKYVQAGEG